jgi:hypothetical protein
MGHKGMDMQRYSIHLMRSGSGFQFVKRCGDEILPTDFFRELFSLVRPEQMAEL